MEKARTTGGRSRRVSRRVALRRLDVGGLATGLTLGTPAPPAATQEPSPPSVPPILEVWAAAWSAEDLDRLVALYTDDAVFEDVAAASKSTARPTSEPCSRPASGPSPASGRGCLRGSGRATGRAAAAAVFEGTHSGDLLAIPATGWAVLYRFAAVFALEGERSRRQSDYLDLYGLLGQLGALPAHK